MTDPKPPFALTKDDKESKLWLKLLAHMGEKLDALRAQNDGQHDEVATARIRGRIAATKEFMALNDAPRNIEL